MSQIGLYVHKCITRLDRAVFQEFVLDRHPCFVAEMTALLSCKVVECKVSTRKSLQHTRKVIGVRQLRVMGNLYACFLVC